MSDLVIAALSALVPGGVSRGGVQVSGRMVAWVEGGNGQPAVILAAGARDTSITWARVLPLLAGRIRVIAYDRAGLIARAQPVAADRGPAGSRSRRRD